MLAGVLIAAAAMVVPARVQAMPMALDQSIAAVAYSIAETIHGQGLTVAVPDIPTLDGRTTVLGRYVAEELVTALYQCGISPVERRLLDRAMSELQLGLTDPMSATAVKRFGRLVGAQAIVVGTLTDIGQSVKFNARIVAVETGQVIGAASGLLPRDEQTTAMLAQSVTPRRALPRTPAADAPGNEGSAGGVFWKEDFSKYDDGDPLPAWGPNVIVRKSRTGRSYLGSLMPGVHAVHQAIRFPSNFSLEFDMAIENENRIEFPLILVDEKGDELRVDCVYNNWMNRVSVTLPGVNQQGIDVRGMQTLKLVRSGTTYKIHSSGTFVTTGVYTGYGRFVGFKLNVPPGALFTNFVGTALQ
jgi:hypothetical protein